MKNRFVPSEYSQVFCPYCNHPQLDINIDKKMFTNTEWAGHTCEKCGKLFGFIQIVERAYITTGLQEKT